jgi:hypothetical protein
MKKRRFVPPLMFVCQIMSNPVEFPQLDEEMVRVITSKDKLVTEVEVVERDCLTPKEYGIKKLGKRR